MKEIAWKQEHWAGRCFHHEHSSARLSLSFRCVCAFACAHTTWPVGKGAGKIRERHVPWAWDCSFTSDTFSIFSLSSIKHPRGENTTQLLKIGSCISVLVLIPYSSCHYDSISLGHIWLLEYQWLVVREREGVMKEDHKNTSGPSAK